MKKLIQLEEIGMLALSIYMLYLLEVQWWIYLLLLLGPDISMIGYLVNERMGAICYNLFHHKLVAICIFLTGITSSTWILQVTGVILFGHSSFDRIFGYGLKYFSSFSDTHLGKIGAKNKQIISK
jgi:hypothetical protein